MTVWKYAMSYYFVFRNGTFSIYRIICIGNMYYVNNNMYFILIFHFIFFHSSAKPIQSKDIEDSIAYIFSALKNKF